MGENVDGNAGNCLPREEVILYFVVSAVVEFGFTQKDAFIFVR